VVEGPATGTDSTSTVNGAGQGSECEGSQRVVGEELDLLEEIGRGSHGIVYKACCRTSRQLYCIKKIRMKRPTRSGRRSPRERFCARGWQTLTRSVNSSLL